MPTIASTKVEWYQIDLQKILQKTWETSVLSNRAEIYVLSLPQRHNKPNRTKDVNKFLLELSKSSVWKFKVVGHYLGKRDVSSGDEIQLTEDGLKNLKRLIKTEILKRKFALVKDKEETQLITCDEKKNPKCIRGSYKPRWQGE